MWALCLSSPERENDARNDEPRKQPDQRELHPGPLEWWQLLESFETRIFGAHADARWARWGAIDRRSSPSRVAQTKAEADGRRIGMRPRSGIYTSRIAITLRLIHVGILSRG